MKYLAEVANMECYWLPSYDKFCQLLVIFYTVLHKSLLCNSVNARFFIFVSSEMTWSVQTTDIDGLSILYFLDTSLTISWMHLTFFIYSVKACTKNVVADGKNLATLFNKRLSRHASLLQHPPALPYFPIRHLWLIIKPPVNSFIPVRNLFRKQSSQ